MKFLKNALTIITLFSINSTTPKSLKTPGKGAPATQAMPAPIKQPVKSPAIQQQKPIVKKQSYKDLVNYIKNATNVWDNTHKILKADFVNAIISKARTANFEDFQIDSLLQTARDVHAQFSDNQNNNIAILQSLENQRATAIKQK